MAIATRIANCPRWAACLVLAAFLAFVAAGEVQRAPLGPAAIAARNAGESDVKLYRKIVADVRHGGAYYPSAAKEQRAWGYPVWPPQVIREPTEALLLSALPSETVARILLIVLALGATEAMRRALARTSLSRRERLWSAALTCLGLAIALAPSAILMHEIWASEFLLLSLALRRDDRWRGSMCAGLAACLFRETALPYLVLMAGFAAWERRWREAIGWASACALFGALFAIHLGLAAAQHHAGDLTSPGWITFGGVGFILVTAKANALFVLAPNWAIAGGLGLSMIGLLASRDRLIGRCAATVALYAALFAVVGRYDNDYWGYLYAPLLPMGLALAPRAFRDLAAVVARRPRSAAAPLPAPNG
jgi:hypothetical protein